VELTQELQQWDFRFEVVLADSLYGKSGDFICELEKLHLKFVVAIRSNHGVWLPPGQRVRYTNWRPFERIFTNGDHHTRYIREIVFGQRGRIRYYHLTTDKETLPPESTWYIMTNLEGHIRKSVDNTYGLRTWIEYGFKHAKNELGWADFRVTDHPSMERWWELVSSAYLLVSLQSPYFSMQTARLSALTPRQWLLHLIVLPIIVGGIVAKGGKIFSITCGSFSSRMSFTACSSPGCCCSISLGFEQASSNSLAS
jgi:hypothetical protein